MMQETASLWGLYKIGVLILIGVLFLIVFLINSKKAVKFLDIEEPAAKKIPNNKGKKN